MTSIEDAVIRAVRRIEESWSHLGVVHGENSSKAVGHVPHVAPMAYLANIFEPLGQNQIDEIFDELGVNPPREYLQFLMTHNGLRVGKLSLHGHIVQVSRFVSEIGDPVSLRNGNVWGRWGHIPKSHFSIGAVNGNWASQGELYLTEDRTVEVYLKEKNIVGHVWGSFTEFLESEIERQIGLYDENGVINEQTHHLPGNTLDWEEIVNRKECSDP